MNKSENMIYSDDQGVSITSLSFRAGNSIYPLYDISRYGVSTIQPRRMPALLMVGLGILLTVVSCYGIIYNYLSDQAAIMTLHGYQIYLAAGLGVALCTGGLLTLRLTPVRYGVRIAFGTLELVAVVSRQKKYVEQIADGIGVGLKKITPYQKKKGEMCFTQPILSNNLVYL